MKFEDICAQYHAKRAVEVAIAGQHSIIFVGAWQSQAADLDHLARSFSLSAKSTAPCPCGHYGDPLRECTCSLEQVARWQQKHLCDPVDLYIELSIEQEHEILAHLAGKRGETQEAVLARIDKRTTHTDLTLDATSTSLLRAAINQLGLSFRQVYGIVAVARTIANLARSECIEAAHLAEAIQYRRRK